MKTCRLPALVWWCLISSASADTCSPAVQASGSSPDGRYTVSMVPRPVSWREFYTDWDYVWQDAKTKERIEGTLKNVHDHSHMDVFLTADGSRIAIFEPSAGPVFVERIYIFDREGHPIRRFGLRDLLTFEEMLKISPSTNHLGWLGKDERGSAWIAPDGKTLECRSRSGRTIRVSLMLEKRKPTTPAKEETPPRRLLGARELDPLTEMKLDGVWIKRHEVPEEDGLFLEGSWMRGVVDFLKAVSREGDRTGRPVDQRVIGKALNSKGADTNDVVSDCRECGWLIVTGRELRLTEAGLRLTEGK